MRRIALNRKTKKKRAICVIPDLIGNPEYMDPRMRGDDKKRSFVIKDYCDFLKKFAPVKNPVSVVADASDGSVGPVIGELRIKGVNIFVLNGKPNGNFPAHGPDPMKKNSENELSREVKKIRADFGAIFDGDGDRVFFVDNNGKKIDPDAIALLISKNFPAPYVATSLSGWTFGRSLGIKAIRISKVGHYFIKKDMKKYRAKFGAETSGHYYFEFDFKTRKAYYDSALRAFVEVANAVSELKSNGQTISGWLDSLPVYFNSGELNFKVKNPEKILNKIKSAYVRTGKISEFDGTTVDTKNFWFNVRLSNTEPLLRLNAEAKSAAILQSVISKLRKIIHKK